MELALENLALRQQVAALKRERPRPPIAPPRLSEQARLFPRCHRQRFGWFQGIVRGRRHCMSLASWRRRVRSRWSSLRTWASSAVRTGMSSSTAQPAHSSRTTRDVVTAVGAQTQCTTGSESAPWWADSTRTALQTVAERRHLTPRSSSPEDKRPADTSAVLRTHGTMGRGWVTRLKRPACSGGTGGV
jgi:hypothetical protein